MNPDAKAVLAQAPALVPGGNDREPMFRFDCIPLEYFHRIDSMECLGTCGFANSIATADD